MTPRVWRPGRIPCENPTLVGPRDPGGGIPNRRVLWSVENSRAGFPPREKAGIPPGFAATKGSPKGALPKGAQREPYRKSIPRV